MVVSGGPIGGLLSGLHDKGSMVGVWLVRLDSRQGRLDFLGGLPCMSSREVVGTCREAA